MGKALGNSDQWVTRRTWKLISDIKTLSGGRLDSLEIIVEFLLREEVQARMQEEKHKREVDILKKRIENISVTQPVAKKSTASASAATATMSSSTKDPLERALADNPSVKKAFEQALVEAQAKVTPAWLSPDDAAAYIGVGIAHFYKTIMARINVRKMGRRTLVERKSLDELMNNAPHQKPEGSRSRHSSGE